MKEISKVTEQERNSTTENINRLINQLEINHNFSQMSAKEYVNCDILKEKKV